MQYEARLEYNEHQQFCFPRNCVFLSVSGKSITEAEVHWTTCPIDQGSLDKVSQGSLLSLLLLVSLKQSFSTRQRMILKGQYTRDHSTWTIGNGDPMQEVCTQHNIPRAWEQQS